MNNKLFFKVDIYGNYLPIKEIAIFIAITLKIIDKRNVDRKDKQ